MRKVYIDEARDSLDALVTAAARGEDVVIERRDGLSARLTSWLAGSASSHKISLRDIQPISVGAVLRPFDGQDDLLDEMIHR